VSRLKRLIQEVHRRSLWQVLGIYLGGAWVALQGIEALVSVLGLPEWVPGFALVVLILGLPIVLATAFVQEGVGGGEAPADTPAPSEGEEAATPADEGGLRLVLTWPNVILGGVVVIALAGIGVAGWLLAGGKISRSPETIRSIAVLPLENLSGDPEQEYFVAGMHEELIGSLARIGTGLRVISRTSAVQIAREGKTIPEIAAQLGVDSVIEGSAMREGDEVRVTVQLIDARDDSHLWAESYDREFSSALALTREISRSVAEQIRLALTPERERMLTDTRPVSPQALDLYLNGVQHLYRITQPDTERAIELFEAAISADPSFARAHEGLARAYWLLVFSLWTVSPEEALPKMRDSASRAIELDRTLAQAHALLAHARWYMEFEWVETEASLSRALALEPTNVHVIHYFASFLRFSGRASEGLALIRRAMAADPMNLVTRAEYGWHLFDARQFRQAVEEANRILERDPNFSEAYELLGNSHWLLKDFEVAHNAWSRYDELAGRPAWYLEAAERGYERGGVKGRTREVLTAIREHDDGSISHAARAMMACIVDEPEEALAELNHAVRRRDPLIVVIGASPMLDCVRSNPRFDDLLRRIGFPEE
jgi:TolB-like protein/Tfp pilus assembly protein PilF